MNNYQGDAIALTPDGAEIPVTATLRKGTEGHRDAWRGVVAATSDEGRWALLNIGQGTLRLPSGREGSFIPSQSGRFTPGAAVFRVDITGSGEAPF